MFFFFFFGTVLSADKRCGAGSLAAKQILTSAAWSLPPPSPWASLAAPARNAAFWTFSLANLLPSPPLLWQLLCTQLQQCPVLLGSPAVRQVGSELGYPPPPPLVRNHQCLFPPPCPLHPPLEREILCPWSIGAPPDRKILPTAVFMGLWVEVRKKCLRGLSCWLAAGTGTNNWGSRGTREREKAAISEATGVISPLNFFLWS